MARKPDQIHAHQKTKGLQKPQIHHIAMGLQGGRLG